MFSLAGFLMGGTSCVFSGGRDSDTEFGGDTGAREMVVTGTLDPCSSGAGVGVYDTWLVSGEVSVVLDVEEGPAWNPTIMQLQSPGDYTSTPETYPQWDDGIPCTIEAPAGGACGVTSVDGGQVAELVITASPGANSCSDPGLVHYTLKVTPTAWSQPDEPVLVRDDDLWSNGWIEALCGRWYRDADWDGFGTGAAQVTCAPPGNYATEGGDCNDLDPNINPGEFESCNGVDDNCDGRFASSEVFVWADGDGDGYGASGTPVRICVYDLAAGQSTNDTDCDDAEPAVNPGADDVCNGVNDDCSGVADDDPSFMTSWYVDSDGDGYGAAATGALACVQPANTSALDTDCADGNSTVHPGAYDACDGIDTDCDGLPNSAFNDEYEVNNSQSTATLVATDDQTISVSGKLPSLDTSDWYAMDVYDDWEFSGDAFYLYATLSNLTPGTTVNLRLYQGTRLLGTTSSSGSTVWLVFEGENHWEAASYVVVDDTAMYYVEVEVVAGASCGVGYDLELYNAG